MKKRLTFLYRYFTKSRRWRAWLNAQNLMVFVVSAVFLTTLSWTAPLSALEQAVTPTIAAQPTAQVIQNTGPTATPLPPEYLSNSKQTIGITLAAAMLVLIVVVGVITFMPRPNDHV